MAVQEDGVRRGLKERIRTLKSMMLFSQGLPTGLSVSALPSALEILPRWRLLHLLPHLFPPRSRVNSNKSWGCQWHVLC